MKTFKKMMNQSGQGLTEYITLLLLIAVVSIGVTQTLGKRVKEKIKKASEEINSGLVID
ncbi:MAG: Flp family type IVb pilin [Bdellovibrionia bacterium]|jgi:Flp pilus assembly pilin Flp